EFLYRGYFQFTLAEGIGFWPAAIVSTGLFVHHHASSAGATLVSLLNAGLIGFIACVMLKRTRNLWMAIGFHFAFDWGQSFFYGVRTSGLVFPGSLLASHFG